jgi:hypothetical protein
VFLIRVLEVLLPPLFLLGIIGYGAVRFVRFLEGAFGITSGRSERDLLQTLEKARSLVAGIREKLPRVDPDNPGPLELELEELVERRLPDALDRQRRLLEHLKQRRSSDLVREERDLCKKLQATQDPELRELLERNVALVQERIETLARLELANHKANARVRAVLINLESFEDHLVVNEFGAVAQSDSQIEALVEDVKLLEAAYDELELDE